MNIFSSQKKHVFHQKVLIKQINMYEREHLYVYFVLMINILLIQRNSRLNLLLYKVKLYPLLIFPYDVLFEKCL